MDDTMLTEKQRKWLDASRKIGPGPMTKTERQSLEKLYADMLPREQQELAEYIQVKFGSKEIESGEEQDLMERMARKMWLPPSPGLTAALSRSQSLKPPKDSA